jgi:hypothetical protein
MEHNTLAYHLAELTEQTNKVALLIEKRSKCQDLQQRLNSLTPIPKTELI